MEYIAALSLLERANKPVTVDSIANLFKAIGVEPSKDSINDLIAKIGGKSFSDLLEEGSQKMSTIAVSSAPASASAQAPADTKVEKVEEAAAEEEDEDLDFDMFG